MVQAEDNSIELGSDQPTDGWIVSRIRDVSLEPIRKYFMIIGRRSELPILQLHKEIVIGVRKNLCGDIFISTSDKGRRHCDLLIDFCLRKRRATARSDDEETDIFRPGGCEWRD